MADQRAMPMLVVDYPSDAPLNFLDFLALAAMLLYYTAYPLPVPSPYEVA